MPEQKLFSILECLPTVLRCLPDRFGVPAGPFALSLSKGEPEVLRPFDKLRANGLGGVRDNAERLLFRHSALNRAGIPLQRATPQRPVRSVHGRGRIPVRTPDRGSPGSLVPGLVRLRRAVVASILLSALLISSLFAPDLRAQSVVISEEKYKAVFLLNCAKVIELPPSVHSAPDSPIVMSVVDPTPFEGLLSWLEGQTVQGRPLLVRPYAEVASGAPCHILFIDKTDPLEWGPILAAFRDRPVLTVGQADGFLQAGGVINFMRDDSRMRFEINIEAARALGLKIPSKLLQLGVVFKKEMKP